MKYFLIFLTSFSLYAGTCTSDSFTSASANSILTSTKYNNDHSTIYNRLAGNLDGGCVTDGTLEKVALNTSEFASPFDSFKDGCKVSYSNASTLSVGPCRMAVDGEWVNKTTATTVSFGCSGCSSEVASTEYYLYAKDGSVGTTLDLSISTTAPVDNHGEDGANNKALARFWNNSSSDIVSYKIDQWKINEFDDKPRFVGEAYFLGTANCLWVRTSTTVGAFTADTDCPAPTVVFEPGGDFQTDDVNLPRITVKGLYPGYFEVSWYVPTEMSSAAASVLAIYDGTRICKGMRANDNNQSAGVAISCVFYYSTFGDRSFELYGGSSASEIRITNNQSVTEYSTKVIVKYLGRE